MQQKCGWIYLVRNLLDGKGYVGQHFGVRPEHRWNRHINESRKPKPRFPLHRAIKRYGVENFSAEVLWCGARERLNTREVYFIRKLNTFIDYERGYNLTTGGDMCKMSRTTIAKLKKHHKKVWAEHPERKLLWSERYTGSGNPFYGRIHSEETRSIISQKNMIKMAGSGNAFYGRTHTVETRELLRQSRIGTKHKPESLVKMSITRTGKKLTPEHCANIGRGLKGKPHGGRGAKGVPHSKVHNEAVRQSKLGRKLVNGKFVYPS